MRQTVDAGDEARPEYGLQYTPGNIRKTQSHGPKDRAVNNGETGSVSIGGCLDVATTICCGK